MAADPKFCPQNLTFNTFNFGVFPAPSFIMHPQYYNIEVPHLVTAANNQSCQSSGSILAVTSDHRNVRDDKKQVISTWASGGKGNRPGWIRGDFFNAVVKSRFVVGYDHAQRSCSDVTMRPGIGYLWFQPTYNVPVGNLFLTGANKYLILTFTNQLWAGCVYIAQSVGGSDGFPTGPVTDPSIYYSPSPSPIYSLEPSPSMSSAPTTVPSPSPSSEAIPVESIVVSPQPEPITDPSPPPIDPVTLPPATTNQSPNPSGPDRVFGEKKPEEELEDSSGGSCFSASTLVTMADGTQRKLGQIEIGDQVRVGDAELSHVYFFTHRLEGKHEFLRITTACGKKVTITPGHYMYVDGRLTAARLVRIGDSLGRESGTSAAIVTSVTKVWEEGLIAPHTLHGDIVVNEIVVSTYTTAVEPHIAHLLLSPVRALYRAGFGTWYDGLADRGGRRWKWVLPGGQGRY